MRSKTWTVGKKLRESQKIKPLKSKNALKKKYNRELFLITIPLLVKTFIFSIVPLLWLVIAFQFYIPRLGIFGSRWVGFDNFRYLVTSATFFSMIRNALVLNVLDIILGTVTGIVLGLLLFEIVGKKRLKVIQTIFFFPYFITWAVTGTLLDTFIGDTGLLTEWLSNLSGTQVNFYNMPWLWWVIIVLMGIWKGAGVSAVVNYAVLMGADPEMYEAANIDGANRLQKMWFLSLPYMKNMLVVNIIMSCSNLIRYDFSRIYFLTGDRSTLYETTDVIETYMYRALRTSGQYEVSTAAGLLQSVVGLGLCVCANFVTRRVSKESSLF